MNTPVSDFVRDYAAGAGGRLHMPGHKGKTILGPEALDITEITGADVLYHETGILKESRENAAQLFRTALTLYSTEGSSLSIRAMLFLVKQYALSRGEKPVIAAGRNAHKVFVITAALLGIEVRWLFPEENGALASCPIGPEYLEKELEKMGTHPTAVYLTSPDYLGNMADIGGISQVLKRLDILFLVDNAHGAYLNFLPENRHPMQLGADLCCDSAHKTLPALTGAAYLHVSSQAPAFFRERASQAMTVFASTSPSYLILQSLDKVNALLEESFPENLSGAVKAGEKLKASLEEAGYVFTGDEPLKLTIRPKNRGFRGDELASLLENEGIFCEYADPDHLVLMLPFEADTALFKRLEDFLKALPCREPLREMPPELKRPKQAVPAQDALYLPSVTLPVEESVGRICASPTVSCPPAIPVVSLGERIDESAAAVMKYYGIETVQVLDL